MSKFAKKGGRKDDLTVEAAAEVPLLANSVSSKQLEGNNATDNINVTANVSAASNGICMPELRSLLEEHRESISRAISAEFKSSFSSLESKIEAVQTTVADHGIRLADVEQNANSMDERVLALEQLCASLKQDCAKLKLKNSDLEGRSRRNNLRIINLPESIEGARPTTFFSEVLVNIFGTEILKSPPERDPSPPHLLCQTTQAR